MHQLLHVLGSCFFQEEEACKEDKASLYYCTTHIKQLTISVYIHILWRQTSDILCSAQSSSSLLWHLHIKYSEAIKVVQMAET